MTARTYIKNNIDNPYQKKLLNGLDIYLRYLRKTNFSEYTVTMMSKELDSIACQRGVGKRSMQALRNQLRSDGYMEGHPTLLHTLWGRVKSAFKGRM